MSLSFVLGSNRRKVLNLLKELAVLCHRLCLNFIDYVHPYIRPIVARRNVVFMTEVSFLCGGLDLNLMVDFVFGLPMMGWARHSPTMTQRSSRPPRAERPSPEEIVVENKLALERAKPSRDPEADRLS